MVASPFVSVHGGQLQGDCLERRYAVYNRHYHNDDYRGLNECPHARHDIPSYAGCSTASGSTIGSGSGCGGTTSATTGLRRLRLRLGSGAT